jgi:DNA-binding PadR family transcriptional regulator
MRPQSAAAKELRSLSFTVLAIRILTYVSKAPADKANITQRLRTSGTPIDRASLNRSLARLRRHGWLRTKDSLHSMTPAGRKALKLAVSRLKDLAALTKARGR